MIENGARKEKNFFQKKLGYSWILKKVVPLSKYFKTINFKDMMFNERIKQVREEQGLPLRKLAAALDIDTASYCKIEKGERRARKKYIPIIAELLQTDYEELLKFWLADQVTAVVADEKELSNEVLKIAKENLKN
jgi:transcriptional regulator with XRE-family HTH domain